MERTPILDGQSRQLRVSNQRAVGLTVDDHLSKETPMMVAWAEYPDVGLIHPLIHDLNGLRSGETLAR